MSSRERLEALAKGNTQGNSDPVGDAPAARTQADRDVKEKPQRVRGVFNGTNKKLDVITEIPGYQLRWFNDMPGRADRAQTGGWEFVMAGEVTQADSNKVVERNSDVGNKVRAIVGVTEQNEPLYAYLMKLKKEWFEEDQMDGKTKIMNSEAEMIRNGGLNTDRIGEKYLPDQRKQALSIRRDSFERGGSFS